MFHKLIEFGTLNSNYLSRLKNNGESTFETKINLWEIGYD